MSSYYFAQVGLVLGVVIIVLLNKFPGEPFDYSTTAEEEPNKEQQASSETLVGESPYQGTL